MAGAAEILARFDASGTGRLNDKEFRALVKELKGFKGDAPAVSVAPPTAQLAALTDADSASVRTVFNKFDKNSSGDIDVGELRVALNQLGLAVDTAAAADVLKRFDSGKTGRLNFDEFRRLVRELLSFKQGVPTHGD